MSEISLPLAQPLLRTSSSRLWLTALLLALASLTIFVWSIGNPHYLVYDETLYVNAARAFLVDAPDPTPEVPPLGKLLVAVGMSMFGDNPLGWRVGGASLGALTLICVYFWVYLLVDDYFLAVTAALLALFNNFLYVMSRVAMTDIYLVAFLMFGLLVYTMVLKLNDLTVLQRRALLTLSGGMFGLACASKWNGIDTLGIVVIVSLALLFTKRYQGGETECNARNLQQVGTWTTLLCLLVVPVVAYGLTYWPLCRSLHLPFNLHELVKMNLYIWNFHRHVPGNPAIASKWYSWLLQVAPQRALSYLVGNWFIMWGGLAALGFCLRRFGRSLAETLLVLLYVGNLLQWAVTPQRSLYYYYYFPCAMFLGVAIPIALNRLPVRIFGIRPALVCVVIAGYVFLFCFPHMAYLQSPFDCALGCWS